MKKALLISVILISLLFLAVTEVEAQDDLGVGFYGEGIFTTFADEDLEDDEIDLTTGFGFKGGGEINIDPGLVGAVEFARLTASDTVEDEFQEGETSININAIRGNAGINILEFANADGEEELSVVLKGGLGYYFGEMEVEANGMSFTFDLESSLGFLVGGEVKHEIIEGLNIKGGTAYRFLETTAEIDDEFVEEPEDVDFGGLELSAGLSYEF